jgi:sulfur relay protein TusB/DsrH
MARILYFVTDMDPMSIRLASEHKDSEVGICLMQDAVYFGCKGKNGNGMLAEALRRGVPVFAAKKDVELRGLTKLVHSEIKVLDYGEIIDLVLNYERIVNI